MSGCLVREISKWKVRFSFLTVYDKRQLNVSTPTRNVSDYDGKSAVEVQLEHVPQQRRIYIGLSKDVDTARLEVAQGVD